MKSFFKIIGTLLLLLILAGGIFFVSKNEALPTGKQGVEADALATKMLKAIDEEAFKATEVLEWSFRNKHQYQWFKNKDSVIVTWNNNKVLLNLKKPQKSIVFVDNVEENNPELIETATAYFNNDSFWLVAPYKIFDKGTERRIIKHEDKESLLVTYTSGGTTPGDSYLWQLDGKGMPISFKMWVNIIPIGGIEASWTPFTMTQSGIQLPTSHTLSLFGMQLNMGVVKAYNPEADKLAREVLKAIHHEAFKKTTHLEWSFGGKRFYEWNKKDHVVTVQWDSILVQLHPNHIEKSSLFINSKSIQPKNKELITQAMHYFNNDSFWLIAPHKLFERGIQRSIRKEAGKDALYVKYTTGGSTPGDAYLWSLDKNHLPKSFKMYVPSMKMEGVSATWDGWVKTESGTLLPSNHSFGMGRKLSMGNVKGTR